jgi:hypothetical protein
LSKFNPDGFEICQDAFVNFLAGKYGVTGEPLCSVICDVMVPDELELEEICHMYHLPLARVAYQMDWTTIYCDLKAYLINTPGFTWIEAFDATEDGHDAFLAWEAMGKVSSGSAWHWPSKLQLDHLYYKSEQSMLFEQPL